MYDVAMSDIPDIRMIPPWTLWPHLHEDYNDRTSKLILRAANLLGHVSEIEALDKLVGEGATMEEAVNAVRAGAILDEHRPRRQAPPSIIDTLK